MAGYQNKLSRFWQELKRRRVIHVITVYASAAFVLIELVGNLTEPLNLPASLSIIVIIVLAIGLPLAIILSWLYDLTSGSFERTKPLEDLPEEGKARVPDAWKIATYVSFVVIAGLIVLNIAGRSDLIKAGMIQSIVILPFDNYTGDENLNYVAAGMHASLIGDIGKVSALRVIGEKSSNIYKDTDKSAPDIAEELNVDLLIEPTLTSYGDTVCILIRAIKPFPQEKQVWVAEYREHKSKILSLWNRIAKQIADQVRVELTPREENLLAESMVVDPEAYDAFLKGNYYWEQLHPDSLRKGMECYQLAIEKDPDWAPPYAGMAGAWFWQGFAMLIPWNQALPKAYQYLNRALELDPNSAYVHYVVASSAVWAEWDWEKGEEEFLKSLELNPNDALTRLYYAHLLMILRRLDEAVLQADLGKELDPLEPIVLGLHSVVMIDAGNYQSAANSVEKALSLNPHYGFAKGQLLTIYYHNEEYEKWINAWVDKVRWSDESKAAVVNAFNEKGHIAAIEKMFELNEKYAPDDCFMDNGIKATRYSHLGNYEKVLDFYEEIFEAQGGMPYIATNACGYNKLKNYPRYIELLKKMNLPLPPGN
jgi:adenylate cyclase